MFVIGMRISVFSMSVLCIYFLSGIIMVMSIVYIFESDHLYKAEIITFLFWCYFTHASMLKANSYIVFCLMSVLTILNRFEKRYNKDGKNKIMPFALLGIIILIIFYIKDNFSFSTFFSITEGIID